MALAYPSTSYFPYSGHHFTFFAAFCSNEAIDVDNLDESLNKLEDSFDVLLDNKNVISFLYITELNSLLVKGILVYQDTDGQCANILNKPYERLVVDFFETEKEADGNVLLKDIKPGTRFKHAFIVDLVTIVSNENEVVKYLFLLISMNWYKLMSNISYSNYDTVAGTSIFNILKECFKKSKINIDEEKTFNEVKSDVKIHYASSVIDNAFTIFTYLMNMLFFYGEQHDNTLKFLFYNTITDKILIFDLANESTYGDTKECLLDFGLKSGAEALLSLNKISLGSINRLSKTDIFYSLFSIVRKDYDYANNKITSSTILNSQLVDYFGSVSLSMIEHEVPKLNAFLPSTFNYSLLDMVYNSKRDIYELISKAALGVDSIIINMTGDSSCIPSTKLTLGIPNNKDNLPINDLKLYDLHMSKFGDVMGIWKVSKVHNFIKPAKKEYTLNIVLFRTTKNKETSAPINNMSV